MSSYQGAIGQRYSGGRKSPANSKKMMASGIYDVIILDEIFIAIHLGLLSNHQLLDALNAKKIMWK